MALNIGNTSGSLYILRHGRTDWNAQRRLQGRTDIELNKEGEEMALEKGRERQFSFDICFSSPLKRAVRTAELYLTGSQTPILTDDRLCEMSFGQYEGMTVDDNFDKLPISVFFRDPLSYRADRGAESVEELFSRTRAFIDEEILPRLKASENILIVGHGAMNCAIISQFRGYEIKDMWKEFPQNCQLLRLV